MAPPFVAPVRIGTAVPGQAGALVTGSFAILFDPSEVSLTYDPDVISTGDGASITGAVRVNVAASGSAGLFAPAIRSDGGDGGGGPILRNGTSAPVTIRGFDLWPGGTLTASDSDYYTFAITYANLDLTGAVTLGSFTTKTTGSGGSGDWVAYPGSTSRIAVPGTFTIPAGKVALWTMAPTGSPANFPAFRLLGY